MLEQAPPRRQSGDFELNDSSSASLESRELSIDREWSDYSERVLAPDEEKSNTERQHIAGVEAYEAKNIEPRVIQTPEQYVETADTFFKRGLELQSAKNNRAVFDNLNKSVTNYMNAFWYDSETQPRLGAEFWTKLGSAQNELANYVQFDPKEPLMEYDRKKPLSEAAVRSFDRAYKLAQDDIDLAKVLSERASMYASRAKYKDAWQDLQEAETHLEAVEEESEVKEKLEEHIHTQEHEVIELQHHRRKPEDIQKAGSFILELAKAA